MTVDTTLLQHLALSPLDHRRALGALDPDYVDWRPSPESWRLHTVGSARVLDVEEHVLGLLDEPTEADAEALVAWLAQRPVAEFSVVGETAFRRLRPRLTAGRWRRSRNYAVWEGELIPRPSPQVRVLTREDRAVVEMACNRYARLRDYASTRRDFGFLAAGLPVVCYGAFVDDGLVGFASANPICAGVTELSWLFVGDEYRRRGLASGLLTAQALATFARGDALAYYAGSGGNELDAMLRGLGFRELLPQYRFIPADSTEPWRAIPGWGCEV